MSAQYPHTYDPKESEPKWTRFWKDHDLFRANASSDKPSYCIVLPPPNVTGHLHMGHALVDTLQDILIRMKRMAGYEVLWVPGTDHAGIATQTVVERQLMAKTGKRRFEFEREEFLKHIWEWKEKCESRILEQLEKVGCSLDFSRYRFTLDETASKAVRHIFKKLYDLGYIYRGDYLVNWDPVTETALADDEVEYEERASFLYHIRYPLEDGSGFLTVATTRPETMLGDVAVAVNPDDERYRAMIGKRLKLPLTDRTIPIIADHYVQADFGTGVVKITPAHDPNDHAIGARHNLPLINILTPRAHINENGGAFVGLSIDEAREAVIKNLQELQLFEKAVPHTNRVGLSYRSKAVIQPYLSKQWFVKMSPFKDKLRRVVEEGNVKLIPNWDATYFHWIDNLRDWCISRQLWWGHRIPIWYRIDDPTRMICFEGEGLPPEVAQEPQNWEQDADVLDTWFSSALWPFSTLGWPDQTPDLAKFYPNSVLITGHDILFFWVARMIMMGDFALGTPPFPQTFIHGLIYGKSYWRKTPEGSIAYVSHDERLAYDMGERVPADVESRWEKMSKSKGNVIDPIEIIETYGADAMRMALTSSVTHARQIDLDRRRFEEFKNFANKMWNGARFVLMNIADLKIEADIDYSLNRVEDSWILQRLNRAIQKMNEHLTRYEFDQAAGLGYSFFWDELCAYYLEISKPALFGKEGNARLKENKQKILLCVLTHALLLLHPMAPFITEEIFHKIKERFDQPSAKCTGILGFTLEALSAKACAVAPYPQKIYEGSDANAESAFAFINDVVYTIRNIRAEMGLPPQTAVDIYICGAPDRVARIREHAHVISALIRTSGITFADRAPENLAFASTAAIHDCTILIPLPQELIEKERARLMKEEERVKAQIASLEGQLSNEAFTARAPAALVDKTRAQLGEAKSKLELITAQLKY